LILGVLGPEKSKLWFMGLSFRLDDESSPWAEHGRQIAAST
jgi:hypothetical protein